MSGATLTAADIEELAALKKFNDALGKPSAVHHRWWEGEAGGPSYRRLCGAGLVRRLARPPKGWSRSFFFGARVTRKGRDYPYKSTTSDRLPTVPTVPGGSEAAAVAGGQLSTPGGDKPP